MPIRRWIKDPFPGLSHFFGAALSIIAMIVLIRVSAGDPRRIVAFSIYGATLIILYLASGLAHSVYCSPGVGKWFDRFDYIGIFLLIAGTYTPVCLIALRGAWGWSILSAEWTMAAIGIFTVLRDQPISRTLRTLLYIAMGWLAVVAAAPTLRSLSTPAIIWLMAGGAMYSIGAVVFILDRPDLWPGRFRAHDLWHCMVLAGSGCHFVVMLCIITPASTLIAP